jgi:hypothetical protein
MRHSLTKRRQRWFGRLRRDSISVLAAAAALLSLLVLGGIFYTYSGDRESPSIGSLTAYTAHPDRR